MDALQISKGLIDKSEDKINAARYLFEGGFYEDSVSRSYYSMHNAAKAGLEIIQIKARGHKAVLQMFGLHLIKEHHVEDYYGKALRFAKEEREKCDYEIFTRISKEEAEEILNDAESFLERIKSAVGKLGGEKVVSNSGKNK